MLLAVEGVEERVLPSRDVPSPLHRRSKKGRVPVAVMCGSFTGENADWLAIAVFLHWGVTGLFTSAVLCKSRA